MLSVNARINLQEFEKTLGDQQKNQTSIIITKPELFNAIDFDRNSKKVAETPFVRNTARQSLPVGNFDWTEYHSKDHKDNWPFEKKIAIAVLILLLLAAVASSIVYLVINKDNGGMHEQSVTPTIPTFLEMSGRMTAPKLQPLSQSHLSTPLALHQKIHHLSYK